MESNTKDRELKLSRTLNAPVELVWEVWTKPEHIANWWGPHGFTNTITKMEIKDGGEWDLIMHGPDGTDYVNKSVFAEIIPHKKIVYKHISAPNLPVPLLLRHKASKLCLAGTCFLKPSKSLLK